MEGTELIIFRLAVIGVAIFCYSYSFINTVKRDNRRAKLTNTWDEVLKKMKKEIMLIGLVLFLSSCSYEQTQPSTAMGGTRPCYGSIEGSPELYYLDHQDWVYSNSQCQIGNSTEDKINKECYEKGENINASFDLIKDYGFTCNQIEYINNHFILKSERKDGGSIEGSTHGLFSSGHIEGKFYDWVNTENVATGKLIKTAKYHLDCKDSTLFWKSQYICDSGLVFPDETSNCGNGHNRVKDTRKLTFYTESDFVMYYVDKCVID